MSPFIFDRKEALSLLSKNILFESISLLQGNEEIGVYPKLDVEVREKVMEKLRIIFEEGIGIV